MEKLKKKNLKENNRHLSYFFKKCLCRFHFFSILVSFEFLNDRILDGKLA